MAKRDCAVGQTSADALICKEIEEALDNQVLYTNPLLRVLERCTHERLREDVEQYLAEMPDLKNATRTPSSLIESLLACRGLEQTVECDGERTSWDDYLGKQRVQSATGNSTDPCRNPIGQEEDVQFYLKTSLEGQKIVRERSVACRFDALCDVHPDLAPLLNEIVFFCATPRSFEEICTCIAAMGYCPMPGRATETVIQPAFVLEQLQAVGAVNWDDGWLATREGVMAAKR